MRQRAIGLGVDPGFALHDQLVFRAFGGVPSKFEQRTLRRSSLHIAQRAVPPEMKSGRSGQIDQLLDPW